MQSPRKKRESSSHLKRCKHVNNKLTHNWLKWIFPIGGFLALLWFLIRVIPKPTRATYPCQRVALSFASGFTLWLAGAIGSVTAFRKAKRCLAQSRYVLCVMLITVSIASVWLIQSITAEKAVFADEPTSNAPIGVAKGIYPGRVVWVHDPDATDWAGPGDGYWWQSNHTDQAVVDRMMSQAIRALTGEETDADAWNRLFKHFNQTHGKGSSGYKKGEKIVVKVNYVGCIQVWRGDTMKGIDDYNLRNVDYMNTSPQMIIALLRQLVNEAGVNESDITVGDTLCYFPNEFYNMCHNEFPNVRYLDYLGKFGRTGAKLSTVPLYWSTPDAKGKKQDFVPASYAEAAYLINLANLKSHNDQAGITLCAKNHYGSLARRPARQSGYYDMHKDLPYNRPSMGHYRPLVDLMGHKHLGGKTLLYLIDGLYAGQHAKERAPSKWNSPPFNGDWTSSLFASQDPVAIDAVGYDFLWNEWEDGSHRSGANDYLIEAAMADNPPSGTFYDPDHEGNVTRLASLGVYEHWNNPEDKQYSRNLGTGNGIELVKLTSDVKSTVSLLVSSNSK